MDRRRQLRTRETQGILQYHQSGRQLSIVFIRRQFKPKSLSARHVFWNWAGCLSVNSWLLTLHCYDFIIVISERGWGNPYLHLLPYHFCRFSAGHSRYIRRIEGWQRYFIMINCICRACRTGVRRTITYPSPPIPLLIFHHGTSQLKRSIALKNSVTKIFRRKDISVEKWRYPTCTWYCLKLKFSLCDIVSKNT